MTNVPPQGAGRPVLHAEYSASIAHATSDEDAGKAFTISNFPLHCNVKGLRIRADFNAGQQTAFTALVNAAGGIAPSDTSLPFDTSTGSVVVGDYLIIDNEIVRISAGTTTPLTIVRGLKGTVAAFHNDNAQIVKANNGLRLVLYKDSTKAEVDRVIELNNLMTWSGTTDAAITAGDKFFGLTADIVNTDKDDKVIIESEEALVQNVNHDVVSATYDYTIFVRAGLLAHDISKTVQKIAEYDIGVPYRSSDTTLYGTLFVDESISATVNATLTILTDNY